MRWRLRSSCEPPIRLPQVCCAFTRWSHQPGPRFNPAGSGFKKSAERARSGGTERCSFTSLRTSPRPPRVRHRLMLCCPRRRFLGVDVPGQEFAAVFTTTRMRVNWTPEHAAGDLTNCVSGTAHWPPECLRFTPSERPWSGHWRTSASRHMQASRRQQKMGRLLWRRTVCAELAKRRHR